jgi:hypothetical protein
MAVSKYKQFDVFVMIEHHKTQGKYFAGLLRISKSLEFNKITKVSIGATASENYSEREAKDLYNKAISSSSISKSDNLTLITSMNMLRRDYYASPFDIKDETDLINKYKQYQGKILQGKSTIKPQQLGLGKGIYLDDLSKPVKLRIDFNEIKISTIAIMFATDIVLKNETANLIESIRKFNEN